MRTFIAVEISESIRENLGTLVEDMKKGIVRTGCEPAWVNLNNMHFTLKFLGNIEESQVNEIRNVLNAITSQFSPFTIRVCGLGMFPNLKSPKVLWIGLTKGETEIMKLQTLIERGTRDIGFPKEERQFHPHLTLARIKSLKGAGGLANIVSIYKNNKCGESLVDKVIFFKSTLTPRGPIYDVISEHPLSKI